MIATAAAARDLPIMQQLDPSSALPSEPASKPVATQQTIATSPTDHKQAVKALGVTLFRGESIAAVWKEWHYGGGNASVKSWLCVGKDSRLTLRGRGENSAKTTSELAKKRHLPEAIDALIKQGLPELDTLEQVEDLTCTFDLNTIRQKFDAFPLKLVAPDPAESEGFGGVSISR